MSGGLGSFDEAANATCAKLAGAFGLQRPERPFLPGRVSIGLEVEIPHSSFFPSLWSRWGLGPGARRVNDLDGAELAAFGAELARAESPLRERLELARECGVARGNDRYWEFAFAPAFDLGLAWEQIELLTAAGLLPRARRQALQATLGGVGLDSDCHVLSMALELAHVDPARIRSGIEAARAPIFTGWARKGFGGALEKRASELLGGARRAVELRALQLPQTRAEWTQMARLLRAGAEAIGSRQGGEDTPESRQLDALRQARDKASLEAGLAPADAWRMGPDWARHPDWEVYARSMPSMAPAVAPQSLLLAARADAPANPSPQSPSMQALGRRARPS